MTTTTQPKPNYKRGDVVLVLFPHSDLRTAKPRPALVVQADNLQTGLPQVIVAMITSKLFRANHPSRVLIRLSTYAPDNPSITLRASGTRAAFRRGGLAKEQGVFTSGRAVAGDLSVPRHWEIKGSLCELIRKQPETSWQKARRIRESQERSESASFLICALEGVALRPENRQ